MAGRYVLALDQGTTGSTAFVFDAEARPVGQDYSEFPQRYPRPGWVSHDPNDIWEVTLKVGRGAIAAAGIEPKEIAGIGITNQRETTIVWDRESGEPIEDAVVWQCRRTAEICRRIRDAGHAGYIRDRTGLVVDSYFSGPKIKWILDNAWDARKLAKGGRLAFGTVDTWLVHKLTKGKVHATDASNASRTMLYDIHRGDWDPQLCDIMTVPLSMLPEVVDSSGLVGHADAEWFGAQIPITGIAGDQQAALFGQGCFAPGMAKNTYGTGCFALANTGTEAVRSDHGLLTTVAWKIGGKTTYALEGSVFIAGAAVQWLRDGLGVIASAPETEALAESVPDTHGAYFVPAFAGLGAPHWDETARGAIVGLTGGVKKAHIVRATLEAICFQSADLFAAFEADAGIDLALLKVDGGASKNGFLCRFQADISGKTVVRPVVNETTALGAAFLAGIGAGLWQGTDELEVVWQEAARYEPAMDEAERERRLAGWHRAVERTKGWAD
ncbi:MAG: glycerol kinase GlpK [Euryarchaeota archaeon]|nr:glycerol kinase GlpK [Euryarchaeota archaeon]